MGLINTNDRPVANRLDFVVPEKLERKRLYLNLPKEIAQSRGKYFRTNICSDLRYMSIDGKKNKSNRTRMKIH